MRQLYFLAIIGVSAATLGFDTIATLDTAKFTCMKNNGYSYFAARVHRSGGQIDTSGIQNILNAHAAGISRVDGYIFPCTSASCPTPANQIISTVNALNAKGAKVNTLWVDVEILSWSKDHVTNRNFITSMTKQLDAMGVTWGIYSNNNNWSTIVGNDWTIYSNKPLWYARYNNKQSLTDGFVPFGGWTQPSIHQYNQNINGPCGFSIDPNVY